MLELKVVQVLQTRAGLHRPVAQTGPWHMDFSAELHVYLDCWGWYDGLERHSFQLRRYKRDLIHDWA